MKNKFFIKKLVFHFAMMALGNCWVFLSTFRAFIFKYCRVQDKGEVCWCLLQSLGPEGIDFSAVYVWE